MPQRVLNGLPAACVLIITILFGYRLCSFISNHAVNLLIWDQWDVYNGLFARHGFWQLFTQQHGPPRLGLGLLLTSVVAALSGWNTRVESFFVFGVVCAALLLALWLKQRLFGKIGYADAILPLIFLTTAQDETFVGTPMVSHSALPLLLIMLYCLAWMMENRYLRYGCAVALNFLLVFTGFGMLVGAITITIFAIDCHQHTREHRSIVMPLAAIVVSALTAALFFIDYHPGVAIAGVEGFAFPHPQPWKYPIFAGLILSKFCGFQFAVTAPETRVALAIGMALLTIFILALVHHGARLSGTSDVRRNSLIICILIGYCLLFNLNAAVGRLSFGLNVSQAGRYMTSAIAGFLGLYFTLLTLPPFVERRAIPFGKPIVNLMLIVYAALILHGKLPLAIGASHPISQSSQRKRMWAACYRKTEDIRACDQYAGISVYPWPEQTKLKEKLDFLKQNNLNLFADW